MTLYLIGAFIGVGLILMARSAWIQGEFPMFVRSLVIVVLLMAALSAFVAGWIWLDR